MELQQNKTEDRRFILAKSRRPSWGKINTARYRAVVKIAGKAILDVGCSKGEYVRALAHEGYLAFGIDILEDNHWSLIEVKRFACANAAELPFQDQSFDTLLAFEVLEHIPNVSAVLQEFRRVCRNTLLVSVPNCDHQPDILSAGLAYSHWIDETHCNFFTQKTLQEELEKNGFKISEISLINRAYLDYPVLRSFHIPHKPAYWISRVLSRIPFRKQYFITILAIVERLPE